MALNAQNAIRIWDISAQNFTSALLASYCSACAACPGVIARSWRTSVAGTLRCQKQQEICRRIPFRLNFRRLILCLDHCFAQYLHRQNVLIFDRKLRAEKARPGLLRLATSFTWKKLRFSLFFHLLIRVSVITITFTTSSFSGAEVSVKSIVEGLCSACRGGRTDCGGGCTVAPGTITSGSLALGSFHVDPLLGTSYSNEESGASSRIVVKGLRPPHGVGASRPSRPVRVRLGGSGLRTRPPWLRQAQAHPSSTSLPSRT